MGGVWDTSPLLEAITAEQPCGENLEDTQTMAAFDALRLFGQPTPLSSPPDWGELRSQALEALGKSKDLRVLAFLGAASLRTDGLPGLAQALEVAAGWLETFWDETYPQVDEDAIFRRNALNCFADPMAVIDGLRRMPLVSSRQHGIFSLRDLDIATGQAQPAEGDPRPDETQINAAFAAMPLDELKAQQESAARALAALKRIEAAMTNHAGTDAMPEFRPLSTPLAKIDRVLRSHVTAREGEAAAAAGTGEGAAAGDGAGAAVVAVGTIRSRDDAVRALEAVSEFFRRNEPSSPVPLFVDRAKRLVAKDFLEVLADIAPDGLPQARSAGGVVQDE